MISHFTIVSSLKVSLVAAALLSKIFLASVVSYQVTKCTDVLFVVSIVSKGKQHFLTTETRNEIQFKFKRISSPFTVLLKSVIV